MNNKHLNKVSLIYFISIASVAIVFVLGYLGIIKNEFLSTFLIQIMIMFAIPLLLYTLLSKKKSFTETFKDCGFKKITSKMLLISIALGFVLYFINSFVADASQSIIMLFGYESISSAGTTKITNGLLLKELILSCILPGFCEEFLHRGIMLLTGRKTGKTRFFLVTSSILFGLIHLNIMQFFYAAILGVLMGYTCLVSDSIYPSIIIHFMNNFLSNYFFYGTHLNLPLASFVSSIRELVFSNPLISIPASVVSVYLLIVLYIKLTKKLTLERVNRDMRAVINELNMDKISIEEAQLKLNNINYILKHSKSTKSFINQTNTEKFKFSHKIFLIGSFILGGLITIFSFIWGII